MSNNHSTPSIAGGPFNPVCETHKALIEASIAIGGIADLAQWATMDLAERIHNTGKSVYDLTVGELVRLEAEQQRHYLKREAKALEAHQMSLSSATINRRSADAASGPAKEVRS